MKRTTIPEQEEGWDNCERACVLERAIIKGRLLAEKIQVKTCALKELSAFLQGVSYRIP
jgi:hypothetical protein